MDHKRYGIDANNDHDDHSLSWYWYVYYIHECNAYELFQSFVWGWWGVSIKPYQSNLLIGHELIVIGNMTNKIQIMQIIQYEEDEIEFGFDLI